MSRFNTRNLDRLDNQVRVTMEADEDGFFGRECPVEECLGYFKVTPGTGIQGPSGRRNSSNTPSPERYDNSRKLCAAI
jgi:hypothetical protein